MWLDGVPHDPGADSQDRPVAVRAVTLHRTTSPFYTGDYSVGKHRLHSTPGTFNFLVGPDPGQWVQFYRADCRCSHAAGANYAGPGIEITGRNGDPLSDWALYAVGQIVTKLCQLYGFPRSLRVDDPRLWVDQSSYRGAVNHLGVDYPPDISFRHFDYITPEEFAGGAVPVPPAPAFNQEDDEMSETVATWTANNQGGEWHLAACPSSAGGGDLYHHWGPGGHFREYLCGPNGALFGAPVTPNVSKVTRQLALGGELRRVDLFIEFYADQRLGHLWRPTNSDPWAFEFVE